MEREGVGVKVKNLEMMKNEKIFFNLSGKRDFVGFHPEGLYTIAIFKNIVAAEEFAASLKAAGFYAKVENRAIIYDDKYLSDEAQEGLMDQYAKDIEEINDAIYEHVSQELEKKYKEKYLKKESEMNEKIAKANQFLKYSAELEAKVKNMIESHKKTVEQYEIKVKKLNKEILRLEAEMKRMEKRGMKDESDSNN